MKLRDFKIDNNEKMTLMGGMNVLESRDLAMEVAEKFKDVTDKNGINYIFKGSFDKANRSSINSFRGPGLDEGLKILEEISKTYDIPVITDIHEPDQAKLVSEICEVIQIPAFLARQTDILVSAAKTGKVINIKKGQFMSSESMKHAVDKVVESGNQKVMLTERGTQFGYNDLIVDFRGISELKKLAPTILDVTHSVQKPNQTSGITGGNPEYIESLARAGIVNGIDGIFFETHTDRSKAKSDSANMLDIDKVEDLLVNLLSIREATSKF